jgi:hypothetical protein
MRNNKTLLLIFVLFIYLIVYVSWVHALQPYTHSDINENVAQRTINGFSLNDYLTNNLELIEGIDEELKGLDAELLKTKKKVIEWIGYGGEQEDVPPENEKSWKGLKILYNNQVRADEIEPAVMI